MPGDVRPGAGAARERPCLHGGDARAGARDHRRVQEHFRRTRARGRALLDKGQNAMTPVNSKKTPFTFESVEQESGLRAALGMSRADIIGELGGWNLGGRGGVGVATGAKWHLVAAGKVKGGGTEDVVCNAEEGEPGTFDG